MRGRGVLQGFKSPGVLAAFAAAVLFGAGTPLAKALLVSIDPWLLAGLLYAGSGSALTLYRWVRPSPRGSLSRRDWISLVASIAMGGVLAPVLLMKGLSLMAASGASLLLNAEGVFTALLAWFVFRENFDRRIALGMVAIAAGAIALSWGGSINAGLGPVLVLGACLAWGIDNNFTRNVALLDATWIALVKGVAAGSVNLVLALASGAVFPDISRAAIAMGIGALAYGASFVLFVIALRHLGSARTTAYFSLAPFVGAVVSVVWLGDPVTVRLGLAALFMGVGVWLHLTERHEHAHHHEELTHEHSHEHDEHHQHGHEEPVAPGERHTHVHAHAPLSHSHHHFPDAHHRHDH